MPLGGLCQVIENLQERVEVHRDKLRQSEALTRNALVDPLLRALGWGAEDPALEMPEYKLGSGVADYALLGNGKPAIVVEAKKLGTALDGAASQGIGYCIQDGIKYFAATDGKQWHVYETHRPVPLQEKKIVSFDIADTPAIVCLDALALWRRSVQNGTVRKAQQLRLDPERDSGSVQPMPVSEQPGADDMLDGNRCGGSVQPADSADRENQPTPEDNWQRLTTLQPKRKDKPPRQIHLPDGSTKPIGYWREVPNSVVGGLVREGNLDETAIPIQRGRRCILSDDNVHPNGKRFTVPKEVGHLYLEADYKPPDNVKNANIIIENAAKGVTADQFSVRLSQ